MRKDLSQRLTKLGFVTPAMDPQAQQPDTQMMLAQQALQQQQQQPPIDPATGQPMAAPAGPPMAGGPPPGADPTAGGAPPAVDPATGQPAAPPPPPPDAIACSVADPNSQQGAQCAIEMQAQQQQQAGPPKMAALRAAMDDWTRSKGRIKRAQESLTLPTNPFAGQTTPNPMEEPLPDTNQNFMGPPHPKPTTPLPFPYNIGANLAGRAIGGLHAGDGPLEVMNRGVSAANQGIGELGRRLSAGTTALGEAKRNTGMYNTAAGSPWVPAGLGLGGAALGAAVAGKKRRTLGALLGGGLGAGAGLLGQHLMSKYQPQFAAGQLGKTVGAFGGPPPGVEHQAAYRVKVGLFVGRSMHPPTRPQAPKNCTKVANFSRLQGTPAGAMAQQMAMQPSLTQQALASNPVLAPRAPSSMSTMSSQPLGIQPGTSARAGMGLATPALPQSGPLGVNSGIANLSGPQAPPGSPSGFGGSSTTKTSAFAKLAATPEQVRAAQQAADAQQSQRDYNSRYWGQTALSPLQHLGNAMGRTGYALRGGLYGAGGAALGALGAVPQGLGRVGQAFGAPGADAVTNAADAFANKNWRTAGAGLKDIGSYMTEGEMPKGHVNAIGDENRQMFEQAGENVLGGIHRGADWASYGAAQALPGMGASKLLGMGAKAFGQAAPRATQALSAAAARTGPVGRYAANTVSNLGAGTTQELGAASSWPMAAAKGMAPTPTPGLARDVGSTVYNAAAARPAPAPAVASARPTAMAARPAMPAPAAIKPPTTQLAAQPPIKPPPPPPPAGTVAAATPRTKAAPNVLTKLSAFAVLTGRRTKQGGLTPEEDTDEETPPGLAAEPQTSDIATPLQGGDSGGGGENETPGPEEVNLRGATSAAVSCGACGNFDGQGCGLLQMPVQPTQTCDAFAPSPGLAGIDTGPITAAGMANKPGFKTAGMHPSPYGGRVRERVTFGLFGPRIKTALVAQAPPISPTTIPPNAAGNPAPSTPHVLDAAGAPPATPVPTPPGTAGAPAVGAPVSQPQREPDYWNRLKALGQDVGAHIVRNRVPYGIGAGVGALGLGALALRNQGDEEDEANPRVALAMRRRRLAALLEAEATGKTAMVKNAVAGRAAVLGTMLGGGLIGSGLGALRAPHGHRGEGAARGAMSGMRTGTFGLLGGLLGGLGGHALGSRIGEGNEDVGTAIGAGLGAVGGGVGGYDLSNWMMGKPTWEHNKPTKHEAKKHEHHDKKGMAKTAVLVPIPGPTLLGGALGAMQAPQGHRWEGGGRGAVAGTGLGLGVSVGGLGGGVLGGAGGGAIGYGLGRLMGGESGGNAGLLAGAGLGAGLGGLAGGVTGGMGGYDLANSLMGKPSWEQGKHKRKQHEDHEKEGHYPGCKSSRKHQARQQKTKKRRVRRKHASAELVAGLLGVIKQAAAVKCGCGCSTCAKCGTGTKQKVRVINGPEVRTNKGHFAWRGRNAKSVSDDPMYDHFGTKAGALGASAAALALSLPPTPR